MKFRSVDQPLASRSIRSAKSWFDAAEHEPPGDAPCAGDVMFEIGAILAAHLAVALAVTLLLRDCTGC
jgi:hypothetical protein